MELGAVDQKIANLVLAIATLASYIVLLKAFDITLFMNVYGCYSAGCNIPGFGQGYNFSEGFMVMNNNGAFWCIAVYFDREAGISLQTI